MKKNKKIVSYLLVLAICMSLCHIDAVAGSVVPAQGISEESEVQETEEASAAGEEFGEVEDAVSEGEPAIADGADSEDSVPEESPSNESETAAESDEEASPAEAGEETAAGQDFDTEGEPAAADGMSEGQEITDDAQDEDANAPGAEQVTVITEEGETQEIIPGGDDNDVLFEGFVNQAFGITDGAATNAGRKLMKAATVSRGSKLTGLNKVLYDYLETEILKIAAGERTSTVFELSPEDLGIDSLTGTGATSTEAFSALEDAFNEMYPGGHDFGAIKDALLADHPYELFWFDKTLSSSMDLPKKGASSSGGNWTAYYTSGIKISMPVSVNYRSDLYEVNSSLIDTVHHAVATAQSIVEDGSSLSTYDRLIYFRQKICGLASYNHEAADPERHTPFGNPWQMIWVFDDNPDTTVVCEGYSKAFKYLCDKSFNGAISCILVSGMMMGGDDDVPEAHMWDIVRMKNGLNYLVDVTNCDEGTIGADDYLFMRGYDGIDEGYQAEYKDSDTRVVIPYTTTLYSFQCENSTAKYYYDYNTENLYSDDELELSENDYDPNDEPDDEPVVTAQVASLLLDGTIGVNFKMSLSDAVLESGNAKAVFVYKNNEYPINIAEMTPDESSGYYIFTYRIPAKEFANTIGLKFVDGDETIPMQYPTGDPVPDNLLEYSAQAYCNSLPSDSPAKPLIDALHNYCAAAYLGLNDHVDTEPTFADGADFSGVTAADLEQYKAWKEGEVSGLTLSNHSLTLETTTEVNLKFTLASGHDIEEYTFLLNGDQVSAAYDGSKYWVVTIPDIAAKNLDNKHALTVTNGTEVMHVYCYGLSYGYTVLNGNYLTEEMRNTVRAIYLYNQAANDYFE